MWCGVFCRSSLHLYPVDGWDADVLRAGELRLWPLPARLLAAGAAVLLRPHTNQTAYAFHHCSSTQPKELVPHLCHVMERELSRTYTKHTYTPNTHTHIHQTHTRIH